MDIKVTNHNDADLFSNILGPEEFGEMTAKSWVVGIEALPMEFVKSLKEEKVIDDLQYKKMVIEIRKRNAESDFDDKENE